MDLLHVSGFFCAILRSFFDDSSIMGKHFGVMLGSLVVIGVWKSMNISFGVKKQVVVTRWVGNRFHEVSFSGNGSARSKRELKSILCRQNKDAKNEKCFLFFSLLWALRIIPPTAVIPAFQKGALFGV